MQKNAGARADETSIPQPALSRLATETRIDGIQADLGPHNLHHPLVLTTSD